MHYVTNQSRYFLERSLRFANSGHECFGLGPHIYNHNNVSNSALKQSSDNT